MRVLVTGSTDGHGRRLALRLAARGHTVLVHGRDRGRGEEVVDEAGGAAELHVADLADLDQVRDLAARVGEVDVLVNNAGVALSERRTTRTGVELTFAVNYLAHVALTRDLRAARIVNVASIGQAPIDFSDPMLERDYDGFRAYAQSKLAQIMWTFDLAADGIDATCLHPATLMDTTMVRQSFGTTSSTVDEGAQNTERLVEAPRDAVVGRFFDRDREARAHAQAYDPESRARLRDLTERLLG